jgi:hypothetical protein
MKLSYSFLIIAALSLVLSIYLPWWIIAPISLAVCYYAQLSWAKSFLVSFISVYLVWLGSIYFFDYGTIRSIVGDLFSMPANVTPYFAAALGGLIAGLFGAAGSLLKPKS